MSSDDERETGETAGPSGRMGESRRPVRLGPSLRRAWVGYQRRLDAELTAKGFDGRSLPDARVLRLCAGPDETTIAEIGREIGITRQGASKIVARLRERGYVSVTPSPTDGREKVVQLTPRAQEYLAAQRQAARAIERSVRQELGDESFASLCRLLEVLGGDDQPRLIDFLRDRWLIDSEPEAGS